ncbi:ABC transporter ATP-binding protein [Marinimicrobium agarilyticum]|uniref:ABC transporter ATP-binding protein n=1 Tax=Marinimicrobium agarilyticum TaxID=306546 RepID=UPI0003FD2196|nr:ABC transporter ATP-binding protein [Marinimicrobium agarilyticum]
MTESLLTIDRLSVQFRTGDNYKTVVSGVGFSIDKGEILALVGESGSGKSVTAQSILRLLPEHSVRYPEGAIHFQGKDLLQLPESQLRHVRGSKISMIFQEPMTSLNPLHSIEKQLAEAVFLHKGLPRKEARSTVLHWLNRVGLRDAERRLDALPHELSGGERQRVMIAMALINEPDLLIADEPTTALDVTIQAQVLELIEDLQRELNMAVLFITHDLAVVRRLADRVAIMKAGEVVETGHTEAVFQSPEHDYTRRLLDAEPEGKPDPVPEGSPMLLQAEQMRIWFPMTRGVFKRVYDHVKAVDDITLSLRRGETLGIVGESGSGKTTLSRALLRLISSEGHIWLSDENERFDLNTLDHKAMSPLRQKLQIIFQDPYGSLSPRMSVSQIIAEGLRVHTKLDARALDQAVVEAMEAVQLDPTTRHRYPGEFSGGQRQRIAIARALILDPMLLILDEPTSALDRSVQKDIIELLRRLQRERQLSYLFVSHDLSVVRALSHRVMIMKDGKVIESGDAQAIFDHPNEEYTRQLMAAIPSLSR